MADEMEAQGADPDAVAAFLEASRDDDAEPEPPAAPWPENAEGFAVFTHCKWDRKTVATMESVQVIFDGISSTEVNATCLMLGVPAERWPTVLGQVRVCEAVALPLLNARG